MKDNEKIMLGLQTFGAFCEEFGSDIYAKILLEEVLEGLIHEEIVFVFGEQEQDGHQGDNCAPVGTDGDESIGRPVESELASTLGEKHSQDRQGQSDAL